MCKIKNKLKGITNNSRQILHNKNESIISAEMKKNMLPPLPIGKKLRKGSSQYSIDVIEAKNEKDNNS